MIERIEEIGWTIWNGDIKGDEEEEWTFTGGQGESVIDYVIGEIGIKERIEKLEVADRTDSDYQPIVVWLKGKEERTKREERDKERKRVRKIVWTEEGGRKLENEILEEMQESKRKKKTVKEG